MTVQGADSINGIRLTEGDFDGCCFYSRPITLSTDSLNGWELTVMRTDSTFEHYSFTEPKLTILPSDFGNDLDSLGFSAKPLSEMAGIRDVYDDSSQPFKTHETLSFDLYGRRTRSKNGIRIVIYPDGTIRKTIQ
jgi:hypothetical protein